MVQNRQVKKSTDKMGFTLRQQKLMKLVAKGMTNKEIAEELHLSEYTVKNHMSRILKRLDGFADVAVIHNADDTARLAIVQTIS